MKIGILSTISNDFGRKGFYQGQEAGLAKCLAGRGHSVIIYKRVAYDKKAETEMLGDDIEIRYIPIRNFGIHGLFPVSNLDTDLDALLMFSDTQLCTPAVYRFCKNHDIAFIPYAGIAHSAQKNLKSKLIMDPLFKMTTLKVYKQVPVVVKTPSVKDELEKMGVAHCTVAPVGLDTNALNMDFRSADRDEIRKDFGYSKDDIVVSFIGRMKTEKKPITAVELFLDAARQDPGHNYKLLMVGEGYLLDDVRNKIKSCQLEHQTQVIPRVPYDEMWKIHYASDFFINLCEREIFGMALAEAVFYESSVAAVHAAGPDEILPGLEGHKLCSSNEEIVQWITGGKPDQSALRKSSDELISRYTWNHLADEVEKHSV